MIPRAWPNHFWIEPLAPTDHPTNPRACDTPCGHHSWIARQDLSNQIESTTPPPLDQCLRCLRISQLFACKFLATIAPRCDAEWLEIPPNAWPTSAQASARWRRRQNQPRSVRPRRQLAQREWQAPCLGARPQPRRLLPPLLIHAQTLSIVCDEPTHPPRSAIIEHTSRGRRTRSPGCAPRIAIIRRPANTSSHFATLHRANEWCSAPRLATIQRWPARRDWSRRRLPRFLLRQPSIDIHPLVETKNLDPPEPPRSLAPSKSTQIPSA